MHRPFVPAALVTITSLFGCGSLAPVAPVVPNKQPIAAAPSNPCKTSALREISKLQTSITIRVYWTSRDRRVEKQIERIRNFLDPVVKASNGKLAFEVVEVTSEDQRAEAKEAGVVERVESEEDSTSGIFGVAFFYNDEREAIPIVSVGSSSGLGFWIINKIREIGVRGDKKSLRIGVLTGTNEIALSDANLVARIPGKPKGPSIQGIVEQALEFYHLVPVDVRGGQEAIDPSLAGLLVTQPGRTLTDAELRRIDEFIMRGGKSAVFMTGATNIKASDASMTATLDAHGIDRLLAGYGIELAEDVVLDSQGSMSIPIQTNVGTKLIHFHGALVLENQDDQGPRADPIENTSIPFFQLNELAVPFASTLIPHADKQPDATLRVLLHSSPNARSTRVSPVKLKFDNVGLRAEGNAESKALAISVEGKLRSAFATEAPPVKGRLLAISSAQYLTNPFARAGNSAPESTELGDEDLLMISVPYAQKHLTSTILSLKNTFDWMIVDDDLHACASQPLQ